MRWIVAAVTLVAFAGAAHAEAGDPAKGEQAFKVCMACHAVGPGAKTKVGPELNGIVGRKWGSVEGYSYSAIAASLDITINTVRNRIRAVYEKLHVHSRSEPVSKAIRDRHI